MNTAERFNRWTVIGPVPTTLRARVLCRCDCGTERALIADSLVRGLSKSCGCLRLDVNRSRGLPAEEHFRRNSAKRGLAPPSRPEMGPCWPWTGSINGKGYGVLHAAGRVIPAHIWSYQNFVGQIEPGLELDHVCHSVTIDCPGNECIHRRCVNPAHLEAVTHRENTLRGRSPVARQAAQEKCDRGHAIDGLDNLGRRFCQTCARASKRAYKQRQRESAPPKPPRPVIHGRGYYTHHGCRCDVCCDAENGYKRAWRAKKSSRAQFDKVTGA